MSRGGNFWSRRKARVAEEEATVRREAETEDAATRAAALSEKTDAEILAEFGLPDPDEMKPGDSFAAFMRREIPERLRRRALRTLWRSNPVLACVDGLNDYDGDFTAAATDAPGVRTAYQVGRGLRAHVETLTSNALRSEEKIVTSTPEKTAETEEDAGFSETVQEDAVSAAASTTKVAVEPPRETATVDESDAPAVPRRMRFRFETGT